MEAMDEYEEIVVEQSEGGCFRTAEYRKKPREYKWSPERRAKQREANRRYQGKFRARENACHTCGKPLSPLMDSRPNGQPFVTCAACRQKDRARYNVKVGHRWGVEVERWALPFPLVPGRPGKPLAGMRNVCITLDMTSNKAIQRLLNDWREAEREAGRIPAPGQIARLVREAIQAGAGRLGFYDLPRTIPAPDLQRQIVVRMDEETFSLLCREARRLRVSRSEAARALLYLAAFPPEELRGSGYPRKVLRIHGDGTADYFLIGEDGSEEYLKPYVRPDPEELRRRLEEQEAEAMREVQAMDEAQGNDVSHAEDPE